MATDYTIITDHDNKMARAIKNNTGWDLLDKEFHGDAYVADAIRWTKRMGGQTFELVTPAERIAND